MLEQYTHGTVDRTLTAQGHCNALDSASRKSADQEAHAAARWAQAVVPILDSPRDPRTLAGWSDRIAASPGALRNWCRTVRIAPRRSLVFGRMLRAVVCNEGGRHKLENLLNVVDLRTLATLLRSAGFNGEDDFPKDADEFLNRQTLVRDPDALSEIKRALEERHRSKHHVTEARGAAAR